jgi:hypothetical protein
MAINALHDLNTLYVLQKSAQILATDIRGWTRIKNPISENQRSSVAKKEVAWIIRPATTIDQL